MNSASAPLYARPAVPDEPADSHLAVLASVLAELSGRPQPQPQPAPAAAEHV